MKGILYGVGVGPGDPELMTLKAARLIRDTEVIALPGANASETTAFKIAAGAVPEIKEKELLGIDLPMRKDKGSALRFYRQGAGQIESFLKVGRDVVFLTLGDVAVYSTFTTLQQLVEADGFSCEMVSGVPSFCAAAAAIDTPLASGTGEVHIIPTNDHDTEDLPKKGTVVLMKTGSRLEEVKEQLKKSGRDATMVENCGMENEKIYHRLEEIPDAAGYYSIIISAETIPL